MSVSALSHVAALDMASRHAQAAVFFMAVYAGEMMACGALQLTAHDGHTIVKFIAQL